MPRIDSEEEHCIDIFDQIITYSYACEWQKLQNDSIDKLLALSDEISLYIEKRDKISCVSSVDNKQFHVSVLFVTAEEKQRARFSVLNILSDAVHNEHCPSPIDLKKLWLNKPKKLGGHYLDTKHNSMFDKYIILVIYVCIKLNKSLSKELKPFVTVEQVGVIFDKTFREDQEIYSMPIYRDLLVSKIHQHYLKSFALEQNTFQEVAASEQLIKHYFKEALEEFVRMAKDIFLKKAAQRFFSSAKQIKLDIDKYYSWAMITDCQHDNSVLLSWYAAVNSVELVNDGRYKSINNKSSSKTLDLTLQNILDEKISYMYSLFNQKKWSQRYLFDSTTTPIVIDGKTVQNHLVMTLPYDKPLPNLANRLRNYQRYISNKIYSYAQTYGQSPEYETEVNTANLDRKIKNPYKKITVSDKGSILKHICTLLCLQYESSPEHKNKLKKQLLPDIMTLINNHGFSYSQDSVKKTSQVKDTEMTKVIEELRSRNH